MDLRTFIDNLHASGVDEYINLPEIAVMVRVCNLLWNTTYYLFQLLPLWKKITNTFDNSSFPVTTAKLRATLCQVRALS